MHPGTKEDMRSEYYSTEVKYRLVHFSFGSNELYVGSKIAAGAAATPAQEILSFCNRCWKPFKCSCFWQRAGLDFCAENDYNQVFPVWVQGK